MAGHRLALCGAGLALLALMASAPARAGETVEIVAPPDLSAPANLARAADARIVSVSVPGRRAERLIDGKANDGWKARSAFEDGAPVRIVIDLGQVVTVGQVLIQPRHWQPGSRGAREVAVALSADSAESGFADVGSFDLEDRQSFQAVRFEARQARYVKLTVLSLHRPGKLAFGEIAVLAPGTPVAATSTDGAKTPEPKAPAETAAAPASTASTAPPAKTPAVAVAIGPAPPALEVPSLDSVLNPDGTEINVAHRDNLGDATKIWRWTHLNDGQTDAGDAQLLASKTLVLGLAKTYAIHRIAIYLPDGPERSYGYRLEGSADGRDWRLLTDRSAGGQSGLQELTLDPLPLRLLRLTTTGGIGKGGKSLDRMIIREIQAFTRDPVPDLSRNLVLRRRGGVIAASNAANAKSSYNPVDRANDGRIDKDPWVPNKDRKPPFEVVYGFHEGRRARVHAVTLHSGDRWETMEAVPRTVEIAVSSEAADRGFRPVALARLLALPNHQVILFPPIEARFVKVRMLDNHGAKYFRIGEIGVYEAGGEGAPSVLDQFLVGLSPESELRADRNIAHYLNGGRRVAMSDEVTWPQNEGILSGSTHYRYEVFFGGERPEVTIGFHAGMSALVEQVNIHAYHFASWSGHPFKVALLGATDGPDGPYEQIGPVYVLTNERGWHVIKFPPRRLRFLKLRVLARHSGKHAGISELQVIEARPEGHRSVTRPETVAGAFPGSRNIAHRLLGGRIETDAASGREDWPLQNLNDGFVSDHFGGLTRSWGWTSKEKVERPLDLLVSFADERSARLVGVAVNPMVRLANYGGFDSSWYGARIHWPREFEVWVSVAGRDGPWRQVGETHELRNLRATQPFRFAEPVEARFVRLRLLSNYGGDRFQLGEVEVYEAPEAEGSPSVAGDRDVNLASPMLGGALVSYSSAARKHPASRVIDGDADQPGWRASEDRLPQIVTFAFARDEAALVRALVIEPSADAEPKSRPKTVKIEATTDGNPLRGYRKLGIHQLEMEAPATTIPIEPPVMVRYLRLSIIETFGEPAASLGEVRILEGRGEGYRSVTVVARGDPVPLASNARGHDAELRADAREREPNETPDSATPMADRKTVGGAIEPQTDADYFTIDTTPAGAPALSLRLDGAPHIKTLLAVEDESGATVATYDPGEAARSRRFTWLLPKARYAIRLSEPATGVVLVFDDSGSMKDRVADLKVAAARYIADRQSHEEMMLLKFDNKVHALHPFSDNSAALNAAVAGQLKAAGNTSLYDAMLAALEALADRKGNRAVIVLSDGADTKSRKKLWEVWKALGEAGVRVYAIGLGRDLETYYHKIGAATGRLLDFWSRATGGRYFFAPTSKELLEVYGRVSTELRSTPRYRMAPSLPRGLGRLRVVAPAERIKGGSAANRISLILDASGSMRGKNKEGITKMTVAKRVMRQMIDSLPDDAEVGLRIYGHRRASKPKKRSCSDSELVVPFGKLDREALHEAVAAIKPKGQTPIGYSLARLERDFGKARGRKIVVLVTDGIETCDDKPKSGNYPVAVVKRLNDKGVDVRVNVVGFDISDNKTRAFLQEIAAVSGGSYFDANTSAELESSIARAMSAGFTVRDSAGKEAARGAIGDAPVSLPEGTYTVVVDSQPPLRIGDVAVVWEKQVRLELIKEGDDLKIERSEEAVAAAAEPVVAAKAAASPPVKTAPLPKFKPAPPPVQR